MHPLPLARFFDALHARGRTTPTGRIPPAPSPGPDMPIQVQATRQSAFIATLAHELRNAMAPLTNALDILGHGRADATTVATAVPMAQRQLGQMNRLVNDLLDFGRTMNGHLDLRTSRLTLQGLVHDAIEATNHAASQRCIRVTSDLPSSPVWVEADAIRMGQVLGNLIGNALKFTPAGGHIAIDVGQEGSCGCITVTDDGLGIEPAELERIFDMFAQEDRGRSHANEGLGIGLAVVRRLVELHGGTVVARSGGRGLGSEFTVRLPLSSAWN